MSEARVKVGDYIEAWAWSGVSDEKNIGVVSRANPHERDVIDERGFLLMVGHSPDNGYAHHVTTYNHEYIRHLDLIEIVELKLMGVVI